MKRILLLAATLVACSKPSVSPALDDTTAASLPGAIDGQVVYTGTQRGDVVLFLFDSASLPPPDGTGSSAVAVARIPQVTLFGSAAASSVGPFTASYSFSQVPTSAAGKKYRVRAFLDVAHSFDPFFDFAQQPRAGAPYGAYGTLQNGVPVELDVPVAAGTRVSGITVALIKTMPYDPPAFVVKGGAPPTLSTKMDQPVRLSLQAINPGIAAANFAAPKFAMELDRDAQGQPRSTAGDGLVDTFPQVFLRELQRRDSSGQLVDVDPADALIIPTRTLPTPQLPMLLATVPGQTPIGADTLDVAIQPFALTQARVPAAIEAGRYQIVVVERTGQIWTLPNSLGSFPAGSSYAVASQAAAVDVVPPASFPDGVVKGTITFASSDPSIRSGNIVVQAYAADAANPPPPQGAASPVRVQLIPAMLGQVTYNPSGGFSVNYRIEGLPAPASYIISVLADADANFAPVGLMQTPTKGDLVAGPNPTIVTINHGENTAPPISLMQIPDPMDLPAFELDPSAGPAQMAGDTTGVARFGVVAKPFTYPVSGVTTSQFTVRLVRDALGQTVDVDHDGLPDVWPRVFLVRLDPNDPTDRTQYRASGGGPVVIPAAVDPTPYLAALSSPTTPRFKTGKLSILARPVALDMSNPDLPTRMPLSAALGRYKIVLMNDTGQVWQLPNDAAPQALDARAVCAAASASCAPGTVQTQAQGQAFNVVPASAPGLQGTMTVTLDATNVPSFKQAYVLAYDTAFAPPPPAGLGQPLAVDAHSALEFNPATKSATFTLTGLPAGNYVVTAVIDRRGDFALAPTLYAAAPGEGTIVVGPIAATVPGSALTIAVPVTPQTLPSRPSFELVDGSSNPLASDVVAFSASTPSTAAIHLQAASMLNPLEAGLLPAVTESAPHFLVEYTACQGGAPTDQNGDTLNDVSPGLRLVKTSPLDPTGMAPDVDANGNLTTIPVAVDPSSFSGQIACNGTQSSVAAVTSLNAVVFPKAYKVSAFTGAVVQPLASVPPGRYQLVLLSMTGQVWRIPNELQAGLLDAHTPSTIAAQLATQGVGIVVTP